MKQKSIRILIIVFMILIIPGLLLLVLHKKPQNEEENNDDQYQPIINKINNKETFNLLITNNKQKDDEIIKLFDYYNDIYSIKYEQINIDNSSNSYNELIEKSSLEVDKNNKSTMFWIIKQGVVTASILGDIEETNFKTFLIDNKEINEEYKYIDTVIGPNFKDYYKDKNKYCLLYINSSDNKLYKYRELLVKNKIRSLVMYVGKANQSEAEKYFKQKLGWGIDSNDKLPAVINISNNKILSSYTNVGIDSLIEKCK